MNFMIGFHFESTSAVIDFQTPVIFDSLNILTYVSESIAQHLCYIHVLFCF